MAEIPSIQRRVGEAASCIDAARLLLARNCRDIMATMRAGERLTMDQRARNRGNFGFAQRLAIRAVDRLFEASGGGGLFETSRIQRFWRDAHAAGMHIAVNWDVGAGVQVQAVGLVQHPRLGKDQRIHAAPQVVGMVPESVAPKFLLREAV